MKYCPNCGKEIDDHAKFCVYCGARIDDYEANSSLKNESDQHFDWDDDDATKPLSAVDVNNDHWDDSTSKWDEEDDTPVQTKKQVSVATLEKVKILLLIILIALVAVGGGFLYSNMNHSSSTKVTHQESSEKESDSSGQSKAKVSGDDSSSSTTTTTDASEQESQEESTPVYKKSTTSTGVTYVNKAVKNDAGGYYGHDDTSNAPTYESDNDVLPDSSRDKVTDSDLKDLTNAQIQTAINEIYARHGYKFSESSDFKEKSYYTGDSTESEAEATMNSTEKYNIDYMADYKAHNK